MSDLEKSDWKRTSTQGPPLHYAVCRAEKPKAALAVVHGYADYAERYEKPMKVWAGQGLTCVAVDLRGHGRSGGVRGHAMSFQDYVDDFRELCAMVDKTAPGIPRLLFAHSFGAPVSIKSLLAGIGDFRALALSEPFLATAFEVPAVKRVAGEIASKVFPSLGIPAGLTGAQMSTDAGMARVYETDPLIFKKARARWFTETTAAQREVLERASEIKLPLFVMFATEDRVASEETAKRFFDAAGSTDKKWERLEGLKHEPLNEPKHGEAIATRVGEWLVAHA